jgi:hypothetical protein
VEVEVEAEGRVAERCFGDHGGDEPIGHGPLGLVGIVSRVGRLGQHVEAREQPGALVVAQVADMTDTPLADQLWSQQREKRLQRRDLLRAGQLRIADGLGQVQVQQQGEEEEEAGDLGRELPSVVENQLPDVGDVRHDGTVVGVLSRLRCRTTLPRRGHARTPQEAEEIRFTDIKPLPFEGGADVSQGGSSAAKRTGSLVDRIAFRGRLGAGPGGGEERADVGFASEVADDGSYRVGVKMKPLGDLIGRCGFVKVGAADLVVPVGR